MQDRYNNLTGSDYKDIGTTLFGGATTYFGSQENRKAAQATADALRAKGYSDVEVAKLMLEAEKVKAEAAKSGASAGTGAGSKTLYIALGVGAVVILGVVIFAVTRKK
jgi:hypothetical protein